MEKQSNMSFLKPTSEERLTYWTATIVIAFVDIYLLVALVLYEICFPKKPPGGKKLRLLCIFAASVAISHQVLQQLIVTVSDKSNQWCFVLLLLKSTILNFIVSITYGFLWLRQHILYSNPRLKHLRSRKMNMVTWIALVLIIINPILVFGLQFNGDWYQIREGICLIFKQSLAVEIPLNLLAFSYLFIQVSLLFAYFGIFDGVDLVYCSIWVQFKYPPFFKG